MIITKTNWGSVQPRTHWANVIRDHPLLPRYAWIFNSRRGHDLVSNMFFYQDWHPDGARMSVGKMGVGWETIDPADNATLKVRNSGDGDLDIIFPPNPTALGLTIFIGYEKTDGTLRTAGAWGNNTATSGCRIGAIIPNSSGNVLWQHGGTTEGTNQLTVGSLTFGADIWAFTTGPRGMEVWQNGILAGSNGGNPTRTGASGELLLFGRYRQSLNDLARFYFFYVYQRQLSAQQIVSVSKEPYCFVAYQPVRYTMPVVVQRRFSGGPRTGSRQEIR